jgi:hypothetical protein
MCLAVYKPANVLPDWGALEAGFSSNKDGAGFVVVKDGKLLVSKGHFTFDDFREAYLPYADLQSAIHFRFATHGKTNAINCHPFMIHDDLAMIHNGVLPIKCDLDDAMSDTWHYVQHILTPFAERDPDFFLQPEVIFLGEAAIRGSKFVFLRSDGESQIWNADDGHWAGDIWYSNDSYKRRSIGFTKSWRDTEMLSWPEDDADKSRYRDFIDQDARWAYDDLLQDGYSVEELDQLVRDQGPDFLIELVDTLAVGVEEEV